MDDILASIAVLIYGDDSRLKRDLSKSIAYSAQSGGTAGGSFTRQFASKMGSGFGASANNMVAGLKSQLSGVLGSLDMGAIGAGASAGILAGLGAGLRRGLQSNGEIERYRAAIRAIEPDAVKSEKAVQDLLDLGIRTGGGTDVLEFGTRLADRSGNIGAAVSSAGKQLDALAALRANFAEFRELQTNLGQIFNRGDKKVEAEDFQQLRDRAPLLFTEAAKALGVDAAEAERRIRAMTGNEFQKLFERIGERNKGLAEGSAGKTLSGALNRVNKSIDTGLAPTAKLIEKALLPVIGVLGTGASAAAKFNQQAAGVPGLLFGIGAALGALRLGRAGLGAISSAISPSVVSGGPITITGGPIYLNGAVVGGAGGMVPGGAAASAPGGRGEMIRNLMKSAGPGIAVALVTAGATYAGAKMQEDPRQTPAGTFTRRFGAGLSGASQGAGLGIMLGSFFGLPGMAVGAAVGGLAGATAGVLGHREPETGRTGAEVKAAMDKANQGKDKGASEMSKAARDLQGAARALKDVIGGGERTQRTTQLLQLEYAGMGLVNAQLGRSGITGVG